MQKLLYHEDIRGQGVKRRQVSNPRSAAVGKYGGRRSESPRSSWNHSGFMWVKLGLQEIPSERDREGRNIPACPLSSLLAWSVPLIGWAQQIPDIAAENGLCCLDSRAGVRTWIEDKAAQGPRERSRHQEKCSRGVELHSASFLEDSESFLSFCIFLSVTDESPQRCPNSNSWNLSVCYLTWQNGFSWYD